MQSPSQLEAGCLHEVSVEIGKAGLFPEFDRLTQLPTRFGFLSLLQRSLMDTHDGAVFFVEMNDLRRINQSFGFAVGDCVLVDIATRLKGLIEAPGVVGRFSGDQFVAFVPNISGTGGADLIANKLLTAIKESFFVLDMRVVLAARIGISLYPHDSKSAEGLLQQAHSAAVIKPKKKDRHTYQYFAKEYTGVLRDRLKIECLLTSALDRGELSVVYQPIVAADTKSVRKIEALLRWNNAELGPVSPELFIPIAEESGLISEIGRWVLGQACRQAAKWSVQWEQPIVICVNASALQFSAERFTTDVEASLKEWNLSPAQLEIEMTESVFFGAELETAANIDQLHKLGVGLSLDDFGTGYSSLSYLARFPFDTIKIDKSFVQNIRTDLPSRRLVEGIIAIGKSLQIPMVAEGVESAEQVRILAGYGCDYLQGYYFSPPVEPELLHFGEPIQETAA